MKKNLKQSAEKERLEIIEKKVDIQKKRMDLRKERQAFKELDKRKIMIDEQKLLIDKVGELRYLLSGLTIDEERTIFGSEPMLKSIISSDGRKMVTLKLNELLKQF